MTIRGSHLLWAVLAAAAGIWAFVQLGSGDARLLRGQLGELEGLIEKQRGESNLAGADKVRRIGEILAPEFEIAIQPYAQVVSNRQELLRVAMGYRARSETIGVSFRDRELEIDEAGRSARLDAVAVVSGDDMRRESYRVSIDWEKLGGDWRIRHIDVLEVLEGNPVF